MTNGTGDRLQGVEKGLSSLEQAVGNLRVLEEENARGIKLIAEGHGAKLDSLSARLDKVIEPLQQLKGFIERVSSA